MMDRRQFLTTAALLLPAAVPSPAAVPAMMRTRLEAAQAEDGAILMPGPGPERVCNPYFASHAALGMLLGSHGAARPGAVRLARRWLRWYAAHLNPDGTIDDYGGRPGALKPSGKYDSSDSYAALALWTADEYHRQAADGATLRDLYPSLVRASGAILLTRQSTGLTHARPDYPVAYLMDNVEVWRGWDAFAGLARRLGKSGEAYAARAAETLDAIERVLWLPDAGHYAWAAHPNGKLERRLEQWYPDQMANLMAIAFLPSGRRRRALFASVWSNATLPAAPVERWSDLERVLWWGMAAQGAGHDEALRACRDRLRQARWDRMPDLGPQMPGWTLRVLGG